MRSAEELLRDGHLRIALAGFNTCGLTINPFNIATNARLMEQASDLPTHIKMVAHPNVAAGLRISLQMLSRSPRGRTGILILSSGDVYKRQQLSYGCAKEQKKKPVSGPQRKREVRRRLSAKLRMVFQASRLWRLMAELGSKPPLLHLGG